MSLSSLEGLVLLNRYANKLPWPRCDLALATCDAFLKKVRGPHFLSAILFSPGKYAFYI